MKLVTFDDRVVDASAASSLRPDWFPRCRCPPSPTWISWPSSRDDGRRCGRRGNGRTAAGARHRSGRPGRRPRAASLGGTALPRRRLQGPQVHRSGGGRGDHPAHGPARGDPGYRPRRVAERVGAPVLRRPRPVPLGTSPRSPSSARTRTSKARSRWRCSSTSGAKLRPAKDGGELLREGLGDPTETGPWTGRLTATRQDRTEKVPVQPGVVCMGTSPTSIGR